jgi:hypothetical protein
VGYAEAPAALFGLRTVKEVGVTGAAALAALGVVASPASGDAFAFTEVDHTTVSLTGFNDCTGENMNESLKVTTVLHITQTPQGMARSVEHREVEGFAVGATTGTVYRIVSVNFDDAHHSFDVSNAAEVFTARGTEHFIGRGRVTDFYQRSQLQIVILNGVTHLVFLRGESICK